MTDDAALLQRWIEMIAPLLLDSDADDSTIAAHLTAQVCDDLQA